VIESSQNTQYQRDEQRIQRAIKDMKKWELEHPKEKICISE